VCVCVCVCVYALCFVVGMFDNKNTFPLQLKAIKRILINVRPVDRYVRNTIYNIPTDSQQQDLDIHNYNIYIYMYNSAVQSS
jgi:hypothetical protein